MLRARIQGIHTPVLADRLPLRLPRRAPRWTADRSTGFSDLQVHRTVQFSKSRAGPQWPSRHSIAQGLYSTPPRAACKPLWSFFPEPPRSPTATWSLRAYYSILPHCPAQPQGRTLSPCRRAVARSAARSASIASRAHSASPGADLSCRARPTHQGEAWLPRRRHGGRLRLGVG